jgi:hypothetical protein
MPAAGACDREGGLVGDLVRRDGMREHQKAWVLAARIAATTAAWIGELGAA